jgi:hypothetical protein
LSKRVIARIRGGLGNQLFCYAAARRLAVVNNADLILDDVTGFVRDLKYKRRFALDHFHLPARRATTSERLEPLERYRRGARKMLSRVTPFSQRGYVEERTPEFDERLLTLKVRSTVYLDGIWASERYFSDVEEVIRRDLRFVEPEDPDNQRVAAQIRDTEAVALHVRWFEKPSQAKGQNLGARYYERAIDNIENRVATPTYFVFSDDPDAARERLSIPCGRSNFVVHNHGDDVAFADLWLMSQCRHFIIANSTFSWWGAWLGRGRDGILLTPENVI